MIVIPAIDLKDGKCVRLKEGKMDEVTIFSEGKFGGRQVLYLPVFLQILLYFFFIFLNYFLCNIMARVGIQHWTSDSKT